MRKSIGRINTIPVTTVKLSNDIIPENPLLRIGTMAGLEIILKKHWNMQRGQRISHELNGLKLEIMVFEKVLMKLLFLSFLIPFVLHCAGTAKQSSIEHVNRQISSQEIMDQARYLSQEVLTEGKENVEFLLKKLKIASNKYKALKKRLAVLENRVQQLVRQLQNREDVEITVEEDGEATLLGDNSTLFDEDEGVDNPFLSQKKKKLTVDDKVAGKKQTANQKNAKDKKETSSPESLFIRGQNLFIEQSWEKAIEVLEEYRNKHPEGVQYPSATYLIGRAFQELNMKEEAQIFFKELVAGYPKSPFAKKAKKLIKNL